ATFRWYALIGEDPDSPISPPLQLTGKPTIGEMELLSAPHPFMEIQTKRWLSHGRTSRTFLVCVQGSSQGYAPHVAMQEAVRDIKILCSLLSLASGRTWVQRQEPHPNGAGEPAFDPSSLPEYSFTYPDYLRHDDNYPDPTPFTLPSWIEDAWTTLRQ